MPLPASTTRRNATAGHFQLTTDGYHPYREAMLFAQLKKVYASVTGNAAAVRYSPGDIIDIDVRLVCGNADEDRICTSHAERHNLTIRTQVRRMTRLTNAFSKKWGNHEAALALFFGYYSLCRVHGTLKTTPAVAAGPADHVWSVEELLGAAPTQC